MADFAESPPSKPDTPLPSEEARLAEPLRQRTEVDEDQEPISALEVKGTKVVSTSHNPGVAVVDEEDDESSAELADEPVNEAPEEYVAVPVDSTSPDATYASKPNIARP